MTAAKLREDEGLWARCEVMPDGSYGVAITLGADRAWTLTRDRAVAYAAALHAAATTAEHDAALLALLIAAGMDARAAAAFVVENLRLDRPSLDPLTAPLRLIPSVGWKGRAPYLRLEVDGRPAGELTPADARDHAGGVLDVLAAADLDAALRRALVGRVGVDDARARAVIGGLARYWPARRPPRSEGEAATR